MLDKTLGRINFNKPAVEIERLVRGLNSWPGTYTYINDKSLKIWKCALTDIRSNGEPGTIHSADNGRLFVNTLDNALELLEVLLCLDIKWKQDLSYYREREDYYD